MSDPVESKQSHEQWCHDRIHSLETELAAVHRDLREVLYDNASRRHHDFFLKSFELFMSGMERGLFAKVSGPECVQSARELADLAYPAPTGEP